MRKFDGRISSMLLVALMVCVANVPQALGGGRRSLGTITGSVRDNRGNPLGGVIISLLRDGAEEAVKVTRSAADGTFSTRISPSRYLLRAFAEGFNPVTFSAVQVGPSDELTYRFNLEPIGQGRTLPERRADRNDPKWRLRSAQNRRSIFQMNEGEDGVVNATLEAAEAEEENTDVAQTETSPTSSKLRPHGVIETFTATSASKLSPNYMGTNFAIATPVGERFDLIFAGQLGTSAFQRLETTARTNVGSRHRVSASVGGMRLPTLAKTVDPHLGQFSVRATDEWVVRDGIVVVLGLDYSRFIGAENGDSLSPRLGFQLDMNARTRVKAAYAPGNTSRPQSIAEFESGPIVFKEPTTQPIALVDGRAVMERSRRLEFGVERVLDNNSNLEATAFFDTIDGRGVGLLSMPISAFSNENGATLLNIANQQGAARGLRVVYTRRIFNSLKTSAGYSFGRGQQLATQSPVHPGEIFRNSFFQSVAAQMDADFGSGTRVRTMLRFSPRAAVFAIDPFAGRLAVYDPSLSILVTQDLPTFGLPVRAEAVIDARNLLDTLTSTDDGETLVLVGSAGRSVRGGISVRF